MRRRRVIAAEYCKEYVRGLFQAFQDGAGDVSAPFTMNLAVAAAWRKIDQVMLEAYPAELAGTVHFRASGPKLPNVGGVDIVSVRCIGSRKLSDENVFYVVAKARDMRGARGILDEFRAADLSIRDWEFYGR